MYKKLLLLLMISFTVGEIYAQCPITILAGNGSTSGNARAPLGNFRFERGVYLVTAADIAASGLLSGQTIGSIQWSYSTGHTISVAGNLQVWFQNTSDVTSTKSTTWTTAISTMSNAHNAAATIPIGTTFGVTLTGSPFTYTGGGLYVAFEWSNPSNPLTTTAVVACINQPAGMLNSAQSNVALPATLGASSGFRPNTVVTATAFPNDAKTDLIYTYGSMPNSPFSGGHAMQARVLNVGTNTLTNLPVSLNITGSNTFTDTQIISSIAPCSTSVVTFAGFTPTSTGTDSIAVTVPSDDNNSNNSSTMTQPVTTNLFSYKYSAPLSGGVGFNAGIFGVFVSKFNAASSSQINEIKVDFQASTASRNFRIAIYNAVSGAPDPAGPIYTSPSVITITSAAQTAFVPISPTVTVNGDFFVGIIQETSNTVNIGFSYQTESPSRIQTFYFANALTGPWTDFGTPTVFPYRSAIEVQFYVPQPPNCPLLNSPANAGLACSVSGTNLTWASGGGGPTGYRLSFGTNAPLYNNILDSSDVGNVTSYATGALTNGQSYGWRVYAYNPDGVSSGCATRTFTADINPCYCLPTYTNGTGFGDYISLVSIPTTTLNSVSAGAVAPYHTVFPASGSTTASLYTGGNYTMEVAGGTFQDCYIRGWIDFNQDGTFDASESIGVSPNAGALTTVSFSFTVPGGATLGTTRLRLRSSDTAPGSTTAQACGATNSTFGEGEDYTITLLTLPACSGAPNPGASIASSLNVCDGGNVDISIQNPENISGLSYQWYVDFGLGNIPIDTTQFFNTGPLSGGISNTWTFYCHVTCNNTGDTTNTTPVTINVIPPPVGGTVSGNTSVFALDNTTWSVTGFVGNLQWQFSTDNITFIDLTGETDSTFTSFITGAGTIYLRVLASGAGCTDSLSNVLTVVSTIQNDNVCSAITVPVGSVNGPYTNVGATLETGEQTPTNGGCTTQNSWCSVASNTVWYSFVAPASGRVSINMSPNDWDSQVAIWSATACGDLLTGGGTLIAANDDSLDAPFNSYINPVCLSPGVTYYIQIDGWGTTTNSGFGFIINDEGIDNGFSGLAASYCSSDADVTLTPNIPGGVFAGTGITGNTFSPSGAGAGGPYNITYTAPGSCIASAPQATTVNAATIYYEDLDGDGFGNPGITSPSCAGAPPQHVTDNTDCDDTQFLYVDGDGDTYGAGSPVACGVASYTDCNDAVFAINPAAIEIANGIDDNCNGFIDEIYTLVASQCGNVLPFMTKTVLADNVVGATSYKFRVISGVDTSFVTTTNRYFQMTSVNNYQYGTSYDVSVAVSISNGPFSGFGPSCTIITPDFLTQVRASHCSATLAGLSTVIADILPGAVEYKFEVTFNGHVQEITTVNPNFSLSILDSAGYSRIYSIRVAGRLNGSPTFGNYGSTCLVTSGPWPTSQIQASQCNSTVASSTTNITATSILGATQYRFRVSQGPNIQVIVRPTRVFTMSLFTGWQYGTTYNVEVGSFVNNQWSPYGPMCTITTPAAGAATTQLEAAYCNYTVSSLAQSVTATNVTGATQYEFKVENNILGYNQTVVRTSRTFRFSFMPAVPAIQLGTTYQISVRVMTGGVWSSYGAVCNLTTSNTPEAEQELGNNEPEVMGLDAIAFPNPFAETFTLNLISESSEPMIVKVYDVNGKMLEVRNIQASEAKTIAMGENLAAGMYQVTVIQGNNVKTLKVIKTLK